MGIRIKLFICLALALLPLGAMWWYSTHLLDRQLYRSTYMTLGNTQRLESARITQILSNMSQNAEALAEGGHVKRFTTAIHHHRYVQNGNPADSPEPAIGGYDGFAIIDPRNEWPLQELTLRLQGKAGIVESSVVELRLVDRRGKTLGETMGFSWEPADSTLVARSMQAESTLFGNAFESVTSEAKLGLSSPVFSTDGDVVGALLVESKLRPIVDLISEHEGTGYSSEAHIAQPTINGDAQFITPLRFDRDAAFRKIIPADRDVPVIQALSSPELKILEARDYRGVDSFLAVQTIPETGWGLIVKIDAAEALAPAMTLRRNMIIATIAAALATLLVYGLSFWPIVRRLKRAASAAKRIIDGDLSVRIEDSYRDEISDVEQSISLLAAELQRDQRKRSDVEAQLRYQAMHDELTGLLNRKHANLLFSNLQADRSTSHTVMFIDLNGFKSVNDKYGHATGDAVLKAVAERLASEVPDGATLARWGGDEFVVILPCTTEHQASILTQRFHEALQKPIYYQDKTYQISCSIGLSTSSSGKPLEDALIEADAQMYEKKNLRYSLQSRSTLITRGVKRAIDEGRLEIWYQPVFETLNSGKLRLAAADAQLRIRSNDAAYIQTAEFICDIQDDLTAKALLVAHLNESIRALKRWKLASIVDQSFQMKVAVSGPLLENEDLRDQLLQELRASSLEPRTLIFELLTENQSVNSSTVNILQENGIQVALPNRMSTMDTLLELASVTPDVVMLDCVEQSNLTVLPHLVSACQALNVHLVARKADDREWVKNLRACGITRFQGTAFDEALRPVDFISRWGQASLTGVGRRLESDTPFTVSV